jgi:hypothetical protein
MIIAVASDHAGRPLQDRVAAAVAQAGHRPLVLTCGRSMQRTTTPIGLPRRGLRGRSRAGVSWCAGAAQGFEVMDEADGRTRYGQVGDTRYAGMNKQLRLHPRPVYR